MEVRENEDDPLNAERQAVEFVTDKLLLGLERRVSSLVFTGSNWTTTAAAGTVWDNDASEPLDDISTMRSTIVGLIGQKPNVCVMGYQVWEKLQAHPDLLDRIKYAQKGILTEDLVASLFGVEKLLVGSSLYTASLESASTTMSYIWGKSVLLAYVPPRPSLMVPAAGYVVRYKNRQVNRYRIDVDHADLFECTESTDEIITSADAGYLLTSVVS